MFPHVRLWLSRSHWTGPLSPSCLVLSSIKQSTSFFLLQRRRRAINPSVFFFSLNPHFPLWGVLSALNRIIRVFWRSANKRKWVRVDLFLGKKDEIERESETSPRPIERYSLHESTYNFWPTRTSPAPWRGICIPFWIKVFVWQITPGFSQMNSVKNTRRVSKTSYSSGWSCQISGLSSQFWL